MVRTAVVVALVLFGMQPAYAHPSEDPYIFASRTTGSKLMTICGNNWEAGKYDPCGAYLIGLIDGIGIAGDHLCPPNADAIIDQMSTIAYRAVKSQPEKWHFPANWIIKEELVKHFGCKQS